MTWQYAVSLLLLFYDSLIKDRSKWCTIDCSFQCIYFFTDFLRGELSGPPPSRRIEGHQLYELRKVWDMTDRVPQPLFSALSMMYVMPCLLYFLHCVPMSMCTVCFTYYCGTFQCKIYLFICVSVYESLR